MRFLNILSSTISNLNIAISDTNVREACYAWTVVGALAGALFGGLDGFLKALIIFMVIDYLTGLMVAWQNEKVSSKIGFVGLRRKGTILLLVILGTVVDTYILQKGQVVRTAVIFTYLSNEGISILENCSNLGLPIPKKLKKVLEQLNDDEEAEAVKKDVEIDKTFEQQNNEDDAFKK